MPEPPKKYEILKICRKKKTIQDLRKKTGVPISYHWVRRLLGRPRFRYVMNTKPQSRIHSSDSDDLLVLYWVPPKLDDKRESSKEAMKYKRLINGKIRDQLQHLLCWGYCTADLLSSSLIVYGCQKSFVRLCPHYLSNKVDPESCIVDDGDVDVDESEGGYTTHTCNEFSVFAALECVKSNGIPEEREKNVRCFTRRREEGGERMYYIKEVFQYDNLEQALVRLQTHPVTASMYCLTGWDEFGIYCGPMRENAKYLGLHEVLMLGCQKREGKMVVICKISNGRTVGNKGYIHVSLSVKMIGVAVKDVNEVKCRTKPTYLLFDFNSVSMSTGTLLNKQIDSDQEDDESFRSEKTSTTCRRDNKKSSKLHSLGVSVAKQDKEEIEMEVTDKEEERVINIEACDEKNPLAVVEYMDDLYTFYKKYEGLSCMPPDYMDNQKDLNERMRAILIDWLIEVHYKFEVMEETLYLTINVVDRFLAAYQIVRKKLQLVGVTALLLACKYEEVSVPVVKDLILISDKAYTRKELLEMERLMYTTLKFKFSVPTPYVFMSRFLKAAQSDKKLEVLSYFIMELCLVEYEMLEYPPSKLVASSIYTAQSTLSGIEEWSKTCEFHTSYKKEELMACARKMVGFHHKAGKGKFT